MIITQKKPLEELLSMLGTARRLALVGCGNCASACQTGGEKELRELKATLEERGFQVVATILPEECCHKMLVKKELKEMKALLEERGFEVVGTVLPDECCHKMLVKKELKVLRDSGAEAVIGMACGDGVQTVADNIALPVYPANNTLFLGQIERVGIFHEYCRMCGDCVLGSTGGICPITKCAKSLVNGPCGGQKNGKCEVNPENDCAWIQIYNRLVALGQEARLLQPRPDKGYAATHYPRHINLREGKK